MLRACGVHYAQGYGTCQSHNLYDPRPVPAQNQCRTDDDFTLIQETCRS